MKVKLLSKTGASSIVTMDKNAQITPHFKLWELANNKGNANIPQMILSAEIDDFLGLIEEFRGWWNKGMNCNSCYRQQDFNKSVGGSWNSLHLLALAFDWAQALDYTGRVRVYQAWYDITKRAGKVGGINFYPWGCHLDAHEDYYGHKDFVIRQGNVIVTRVPKP